MVVPVTHHHHHHHSDDLTIAQRLAASVRSDPSVHSRALLLGTELE